MLNVTFIMVPVFVFKLCFFFTFFNQVHVVRAKDGFALLLSVTHFHIKVML